MPRLLSGFLCTAKPDFFALLNQISLHCSTNFFVVTKLDSSEPTWAGVVGAKVVQVFWSLSQPNKQTLGPALVHNCFLVSIRGALQSVQIVVQSAEEGVQ